MANKNIDNFDIYDASPIENRSSIGSGGSTSMNVMMGDEESGTHFATGTGANEHALLRAGISPSSAFLEDTGALTNMRPTVDAAVLLKHGVDPASCLPGNDDESSVAPSTSSHIGSVHVNEDGIPSLSHSNGRSVLSSGSSTRSKEARKRYALVAFIGALLLVVVALSAVIGVSAKRGREAAAQYGSFNGAQGPPEGVDVSDQGGEGATGVDGLDEGYEEYAGPPSGVDTLEEGSEQQDDVEDEDAPDGIFQGTSEYQPTLDPNEEITSIDIEEALVAAEVEELIFSTPEAELVVAATSSSPPTSSPTATPSAPEEEADDAMDTWNGHVDNGRCFDGMSESLCCFFFWCR